MAFEVDHSELSDVTTLVSLRGRLALGSEFPRAEKAIGEALASGRKNIVFDLDGLTHIDSTGMGLFINTHGKIQKAGGKMFLAAAKGAVRDSFRVTRLDTVLKFYPTVEAASAALA